MHGSRGRRIRRSNHNSLRRIGSRSSIAIVRTRTWTARLSRTGSKTASSRRRTARRRHRSGSSRNTIYVRSAVSGPPQRPHLGAPRRTKGALDPDMCPRCETQFVEFIIESKIRAHYATIVDLDRSIGNEKWCPLENVLRIPIVREEPELNCNQQDSSDKQQYIDATVPRHPHDERDMFTVSIPYRKPPRAHNLERTTSGRAAPPPRRRGVHRSRGGHRHRRLDPERVHRHRAPGPLAGSYRSRRCIPSVKRSSQANTLIQ